MNEPKKVKCVFVGNAFIGKTDMLCGFGAGRFTRIPQIMENPIAIVIQEKTYQIDLVDTPGHERSSRVRHFDYPRADVFVLCFSIDSPESFSSIKSQWLPEVKRYGKNTPLVLVGTRSDLRENLETIQRLKENGQRVITSCQGAELARKIKAVCYIECCYGDQDSLREVLEKVASVGASLITTSRKLTCCTL